MIINKIGQLPPAEHEIMSTPRVAVQIKGTFVAWPGAKCFIDVSAEKEACSPSLI